MERERGKLNRAGLRDRTNNHPYKIARRRPKKLDAIPDETFFPFDDSANKIFHNANAIVSFIEKKFGLKFDPDNKLDLNHPDYIYLHNIKTKIPRHGLLPKEVDIEAMPELGEMIKTILFGDSYSFLANELFITTHDFKQILFNLNALVRDDCRKRKLGNEDFLTLRFDCFEFMICQTIGLRLYREIQYHHPEFPFKKISDDNLQEDFKQLVTYIQNYNPSFCSYDKKLPRVEHGKLVSERYMQELRYCVTNGNIKNPGGIGFLDPVTAWIKPNIATTISGDLRVIAIKARKVASKRTLNYSLTQKNWALSFDDIIQRLVSKHGANQFSPGYMGVLIHFLHANYQANIRNVLDLCGGWGERLVGACAAAVALGVRRYVTTDPNEALQVGYRQIVQQIKPEGMEVYHYDQPMEDLNWEQLSPGGIRSDLMYTSPPFFNLEQYPGENQSASRYSNIDSWYQEFLFKLVNTALQASNPLGFIVIHIGKAGKNKIYDIPTVLFHHLKGLEASSMLKYLGSFHSSSIHDATFTYVVQCLNIVADPFDTLLPVGEPEEALDTLKVAPTEDQVALSFLNDSVLSCNSGRFFSQVTTEPFFNPSMASDTAAPLSASTAQQFFQFNFAP